MDREREKVALQARLDLCSELLAEFPGGLTAQHIRLLEASFANNLRALEQSSGEDAARRLLQDVADDRRAIAEKLRRKMN